MTHALQEEDTIILDDIAGLVNGGNTLTVYDPDGREVVRADYSGEDVSLKQTVTYSYPKDNTRTMEKLADGQSPTPGWVIEDQAPDRPVSSMNRRKHRPTWKPLPAMEKPF